MEVEIVLLRGINLGARNRIAMPALREALSDGGLRDVRTYLQSGNVVLRSELGPDKLARECERRIVDAFGLQIDVLVRTCDELADVVRRDPLGEVARDPKRYQVTFLNEELDEEAVDRLEAVRAEAERLVVIGRECYSWHPDGAARSKLWSRLAGRGLGAGATARNWTTVTNLLALADE